MKHVVLVEDDEPISDVFQLIFKDTDYQITNLEDGKKIISGEISTPDLFILDKNIPGMNGLEVCRFIKNSGKFKQVPVVMLSANLNIAELAKEAGADDAIVKPFSLKKIRETVSKYTALKNA